MLQLVSGNMFAVSADIRVNTVNCVGAMGAGVALLFKKRYPKMFADYQRACRAGEVRPGRLHIWKAGPDWVVNFPTKRHWKDPSRYEDVEAGLKALREYLQAQGKVTVALPALGCGLGGLSWERVFPMIQTYLADLDAHIFVFKPREV